MTEDTTAAERIRRLQERRTASSPRAVGVTRTAKPRRRHPAMAARILLAGMSVASFFGIASGVALANGAATSASPTPATTPGVVLPAAAGGVAAVQASNVGTAAKAGVATATAPQVTTRGS